jgi:membrane fusion protein (multidrug efflux system)
VRRRALVIPGLAFAVLVVLVVSGIVQRKSSVDALAKVATEQAMLPVQIITPQPGPTSRPLILPGTVSAWYEAPIFAQVSGYVVSWNVDYGAVVKAGQLLATIATPSLDAEYRAAQASRGVAQANYHLAATTAARWQALAGTVAVSKQEVDVQVAAAAASKAALDAATQNVAHYAALEAFKRVVAPFDGIVTARLTDVGSYVNAAGGDVSARGNSTELFIVSDMHALRIFVAVPQDYSDQLVPGLTASLHLPSQPDKLIAAKYLTTARAFSTTTRTTVTELTVDNQDRSLWPGTYVDVEFRVPSDPKVLTIPEGALIFRAAGAQVAVVDTTDKVHLRNVNLGQNLGETIQVIGGLSPGEKLVNNPPSGLLEGQIVRPVMPAEGYAPAPQPTP